jgi:hypothetical protein
MDPAGRLIVALLETRDGGFDPPPFDAAVATAVLGPAGAPLTPHRRLLELANGAYLHGQALHLLGACQGPPWHALPAWNAPTGFRHLYGPAAAGLTFFAEDAFGDQFAYRGEQHEVVIFEAELGRVVPFAPHFVAWLEEMVERPAAVLPIDVMERERAAKRHRQPGTQLFAWPPLSAVEAREGVSVGHVDALEAMCFRARLAARLREVPPGTPLQLALPELASPEGEAGADPANPFARLLFGDGGGA